jgi:hypothetical protein
LRRGGIGDHDVEPPAQQRGPQRLVLRRTSRDAESAIGTAKLLQRDSDDQVVEVGVDRFSVLVDVAQVVLAISLLSARIAAHNRWCR